MSKGARKVGASPADAVARRKKRLEQLLNLALAYKNCTRKELAKTLGRDPTKLVPGTGIPKLDLVVELAGVLDWPVGDVVSYLWQRQATAPDLNGPAHFPALDRAAARAGRDGNHQLMAELAMAAWAAAADGAQRVRASEREARGWRRLGRYLEVVKAISRGLHETGASATVRRRLRMQIAGAYYALWSLAEARALARDTLEELAEQPPATAQDRRHRAAAFYLAGQACRRLMSIEPHRGRRLAAEARETLEQALALHRRLALHLDDPALEGIANTCCGALIEVDVALGRRRPGQALAQISMALERVRDITVLPEPRLESYGWWCIYGCNIALRHLRDDRELQQHMAVFTNKADEIANQLDDWAMRERVFTMQYSRWELAAGSTCFEIPCVIDRDDVRVITGTMGRFPSFRPTGWRILRTARIVDW